MDGGAIFDASGAYRYRLWREWDELKPAIAFVMLNPSTADAETDDPTIRRCVRFARSWGFGRLEVVNLCAYRATTPADLFAATDPEGTDNANHLDRACQTVHRVVVAWGNHGIRLMPARVPGGAWSFGLTKLGQPRHPLYVPGSTALQRFSW